MPEHWNFNDTIVWKGIICKFICEKKKSTVQLAELLSYDKIPIIAGAYNQNDIINAIHDDKSVEEYLEKIDIKPEKIIIELSIKLFILK